MSMVGTRLQTDLDYFLWSLREEPQVVRPHAVAVERNGAIEAIAVARLANVRLPCNVGYSTVYAPEVRAILVAHDGLLGRADGVTAAALVDEPLRNRAGRGRRRRVPPAAARLGASRRRARRLDVPDPTAPLASGRALVHRLAADVRGLRRIALLRNPQERPSNHVPRREGIRRPALDPRFPRALRSRRVPKRCGGGGRDDLSTPTRRRLRVRRATAGPHANADGTRLVAELRALPRRTPDRLPAGRDVWQPVRLRRHGPRPSVRPPSDRCVSADKRDRGSHCGPLCLRPGLRLRRRGVQAQPGASLLRGSGPGRLCSAAEAALDQPCKDQRGRSLTGSRRSLQQPELLDASKQWWRRQPA
jgi:hypothetical protein